MDADTCIADEGSQSQLSRSNDSPEVPFLSPLSRTTTTSTESTHTIRGENFPRRPGLLPHSSSYPQPLTPDDMQTPLGTPASHTPFTALSPTIPPTTTPARLAKGNVAEEFKASGRLQQSARREGQSQSTSPATSPDQKLDFFGIAVQLQSEPGLNGWWKQTTQVLRDVFQAERATLAVPSDSTEIENVPWAQLTSFNNAGNDHVSEVAVDADSTESTISELLAKDASFKDGKREREMSANLGSSSNNSTNLSARPKLESRHSYAGYPPRYTGIQPPSNPSFNRRSKASRIGSQTPVFGSKLKESGEPDPRRIYRHDSEKSYGILSDDTNLSVAGGYGTVLDVMQPLDIERDPLIVPAGIVKVLNNSRATVLTRKYLGPANLVKPSTGNLTKRSITQQRSSHEQHSKFRTHVRQGSSTGVAERSSEANRKEGILTSEQGGNVYYEDYEQIPGTPWAQSPAPSPAAMIDPDDNPFFSSSDSVKEAFKKHPPDHKYGDDSKIAAIGLDYSSTILQIPLVHPSATLSLPQRTHRLYEDRRPKEPNDGKHFETRGRRQGSLERKKKIPIAILSILAPVVPYPLELIDALNRLSPVFATSFYAARQHTNLHTEVLGLSHQRALSSDRPHLREDRSLAFRNLRSSTGFANDDIVREESFSPMSTSSAASSGEYVQPMVFHGPQTPSAPSEEKSITQAQESASQNEKDRGPRPSPVRERSEGYFPSNLSLKVSHEKELPSRRISVKTSQQTRRSGMQTKAQILHSHGATFHNTHPSLPTATTTPNVEDDAASENHDTSSRPFKEPSLSLLRSMIDIGATQQFIAESDSGKLLWVNSKFQAYRSGSSGQRLDDQFWDNIYPKDRKNFRREWLNALETGEQLSQQLRLARFDGQYRWFHIKFLPLKDKFGLVQYWSGQAMDIHDLHEAEVKAAKAKEKTASEAKYRAIANSLPVIVFAASIPAGMTFANTQWLSYSGQSLEEALGFGFLNHVHPDDLVKCRFPGIGDASIFPPRPANSIKTQRTSALRTESTTSSAAESEDTAVPGNFALKTASNAPPSPLNELQIPNELLRSLAKDGVILCTKDGQGNLSITTEMRLKSKDGLYRWHLVQGSYIESVNFGQGEAQWFIACTDISVQKKNEAKIQSTNSALEEMNSTLEAEMQRKMGYLSSMSHEIRTPLNGIIGNLQFLINSGLGESAGEWAHGAQEAAKGMHELINGILDLSKAEAKMLTLDKHWFNPRHLMETVMDLLNAKSAEKKIEICHECAPSVPQTIRGDEGRIKQVLLNLAGNSIKFTNVGEVIIKCDIPDELPSGFEHSELRENEMFIRWTIKDTGIGFSGDDKKLLFKAYSQIKTKSTRDISGTGLGLLLCKTMVNLHGGEISAQSDGPTKGASFSFFARFKVKRDHFVAQSSAASSFPSPNIAVPVLEPSKNTLSPGRRTDSPASMVVNSLSQGSPALLSDSSSAPSLQSISYQRSSTSTVDSSGPDVAMKLTLPPATGSSVLSEAGGIRKPTSPATAGKGSLLKHGSVLFPPPKAGPSSPKSASVSAEAFLGSISSPRRVGSIGPKSDDRRSAESVSDLERSNFRPPMLSVLVVCPPEATRRITCNRIEYVAPRSTPCNITSEGSVDAAMNLLLGKEPIFFTHVVLRFTEDDVIKQCLKKILDSPRHSQLCIVVVTDQIQQDLLKAALPDLDFDALGRSDRIKMLLKPAHAYKLSKIFDPFNENAKMIGDPKEAKRKEEKRLQKEAYSLFKRILGGKGLRVLAVEDNKLQMHVRLTYFVFEEL